MIVAAGLTRSSERSLETFGAQPVPERTRTAVLALACLVPFTVGLLWVAFMLSYFSINRPVPSAWWFDTLPAGDIVAYYLAAAGVAAYGGPILGVVVGRWLRWSGAPVVAVLLVAVTVPGSGIGAFRPYREIMPWTHWFGGDARPVAPGSTRATHGGGCSTPAGALVDDLVVACDPRIDVHDPDYGGGVEGRRLPLAPRPRTEPHPSRLAPDHPRRAEILAAHAAALAEARPGYLDPDTGLFVLTAGFLADRGTCCGRGCRHCPYVDGV